MKSISIPMPFGGRVHLALERHGALHARSLFHTNLKAALFRRGLYQGEKDLGSGLVTNVGALALANDFAWASPSGAAVNVFKLANNHATGTGTNAAATSDIKLQTASTNGGQTPTAGTKTLVSAANSQKWQTVADVAYSGSESVTEWGLFMSSTLPSGALSSSTGTPFTGGSATTGTVTGTPLTASSSTIQGQQGSIFENTGSGTPHWGLVLSNTTSIVTVPAWYKVSDGTAAGTFPSNGDAYLIRPVMWDRKVFSVISVDSLTTIRFTYTLTITAGG